MEECESAKSCECTEIWLMSVLIYFMSFEISLTIYINYYVYTNKLFIYIFEIEIEGG